jgi:hypothetical protein
MGFVGVLWVCLWVECCIVLVFVGALSELGFCGCT